MVDFNEMHSLIERLIDDYQNPKEHYDLIRYLEQLLEDRSLRHGAAIGSVKQAISRGLDSLTKLQLKAISKEMLEKKLYMSHCPNDWCRETISWDDMGFALSEGQCRLCVYRADRIEYD